MMASSVHAALEHSHEHLRQVRAAFLDSLYAEQIEKGTHHIHARAYKRRLELEGKWYTGLAAVLTRFHNDLHTLDAITYAATSWGKPSAVTKLWAAIRKEEGEYVPPNREEVAYRLRHGLSMRGYVSGGAQVYSGLAGGTVGVAGETALQHMGIGKTWDWTHNRAMANDLTAVRGSKVIQDMYGDHVDRLAKIITEATDPRKPKTIQQVQQELRAEWPGLRRYEVERIARTETAAVWTATSANTYAANGISAFESTIATGPSIGVDTEDPCEECIDAAAEVQSMDDDLPPWHPNCRCEIVPVLEDPETGDLWLPPDEPFAGGEWPDEFEPTEAPLPQPAAPSGLVSDLDNYTLEYSEPIPGQRAFDRYGGGESGSAQTLTAYDPEGSGVYGKGKIAGYFNYEQTAYGTKVNNIQLPKEYQGKGLGSSLLAKVYGDVGGPMIHGGFITPQGAEFGIKHAVRYPEWNKVIDHYAPDGTPVFWKPGDPIDLPHEVGDGTWEGGSAMFDQMKFENMRGLKAAVERALATKPADTPRVHGVDDLEAARAQLTTAGNRLSGLKTRLKAALRDGDAEKESDLRSRITEQQTIQEQLRQRVRELKRTGQTSERVQPPPRTEPPVSPPEVPARASEPPPEQDIEPRIPRETMHQPINAADGAFKIKQWLDEYEVPDGYMVRAEPGSFDMSQGTYENTAGWGVYRRDGVVIQIEMKAGTEVTDFSMQVLKEKMDALMDGLPKDIEHLDQLKLVRVMLGHSPDDAYFQQKYKGFGHAAAQGGQGGLFFWSGSWGMEEGVFNHELGHITGVEGGPPVHWKWLTAQADDKFISSSFSGVRSVTAGHPLRTDTKDVTTYAGNSINEDWAESVRLYLADARDGKVATGKPQDSPFVKPLRFRDLWPNRANILDEHLRGIGAPEVEATPAERQVVELTDEGLQRARIKQIGNQLSGLKTRLKNDYYGTQSADLEQRISDLMRERAELKAKLPKPTALPPTTMGVQTALREVARVERAVADGDPVEAQNIVLAIEQTIVTPTPGLGHGYAADLAAMTTWVSINRKRLEAQAAKIEAREASSSAAGSSAAQARTRRAPASRSRRAAARSSR